VTQTDVVIFGKTYTIVGEERSERLFQLAAYVDSKMREVAEHLLTITLSRVAILAALNIAGELFQLRDRAEQQSVSLEKCGYEILDLIEQRCPDLDKVAPTGASKIENKGVS